eukprot:3519466-Pyramimonas_sp.AAC.1
MSFFSWKRLTLSFFLAAKSASETPIGPPCRALCLALPWAWCGRSGFGNLVNRPRCQALPKGQKQ